MDKQREEFTVLIKHGVIQSFTWSSELKQLSMKAVVECFLSKPQTLSEIQVIKIKVTQSIDFTVECLSFFTKCKLKPHGYQRNIITFT